ncbi:hypothetical protein DRN74_05850 [Candidatus Micrarchaeota archaeon]|nr:MAG: hypothetical protein DRN74_05850 [Candidatus Micrarchaeota archaeon]
MPGLFPILAGLFIFLILLWAYIEVVREKRDYCLKCGSRAWWFHAEETRPILGGIAGKAVLICFSCTPILCTECGKERAVRPGGHGYPMEMGTKFFKRKIYSKAYCRSCLVKKATENLTMAAAFIPASVVAILVGLRISRLIHPGWSAGSALFCWFLCGYILLTILEKHAGSRVEKLAERFVKILLKET